MSYLRHTAKSKTYLLTCGIFWYLILVFTDQLTKHFVVLNSDLLQRYPVIVIPNFFNIVSIRNTGAAWGMFGGNNFLLLAIAIIAVIIFVIFFKIITEWYTERVLAFFMILSGITGNCIDRIFRGSVVDFLDFYYKSWHWPAFNVADSAICVGVIIIIISSFLRFRSCSKITFTSARFFWLIWSLPVCYIALAMLLIGNSPNHSGIIRASYQVYFLTTPE